MGTFSKSLELLLKQTEQNIINILEQHEALKYVVIEHVLKHKKF